MGKLDKLVVDYAMDGLLHSVWRPDEHGVPRRVGHVVCPRTVEGRPIRGGQLGTVDRGLLRQVMRQMWDL